MFVIRVLVYCPDGGSEATPDELDHNELMVETLVSLALLQVFQTVNVGRVEVTYQPDEQQ